MEKIIFNDSTDYDSVLIQCKLMFSKIVSDSCGCDCGCTNDKLCKSLIYITASDINKSNLDQVRYEESVKAAYLTLKCSC